MGFTVEPADGRCLVRLHDSITINCAARLHRALSETLDLGRPVAIDLEGAADIDISVIQILDAAAKSAASAGGSFTLSGTPPEAIASALHLSGLDPFARPSQLTVEGQ